MFLYELRTLSRVSTGISKSIILDKFCQENKFSIEGERLDCDITINDHWATFGMMKDNMMIDHDDHGDKQSGGESRI